MEHLWTDGPMPFAYLELKLCRDIYHCPPSQLPKWGVIRKHLICLSAEAGIEKMKASNG